MSFRLNFRPNRKPPVVETTEEKAFFRQYLNRPVGFGFLETFCPLPCQVPSKRAEYYWGIDQDYDVRASHAEPKHSDYVYFNDTALPVVTGIQRAFPALEKVLRLTPGEPGQLPLDKTVFARLQARWARAAKQYAASDYPIFDVKYHRCVYCGDASKNHVDAKCLFHPTQFTPHNTEWRTLVGDFVWDKNSGSFVKKAGSTTTTGTTATTTTEAGNPSPSTKSKRPRKKSAAK